MRAAARLSLRLAPIAGVLMAGWTALSAALARVGQQVGGESVAEILLREKIEHGVIQARGRLVRRSFAGPWLRDEPLTAEDWRHAQVDWQRGSLLRHRYIGPAGALPRVEAQGVELRDTDLDREFPTDNNAVCRTWWKSMITANPDGPPALMEELFEQFRNEHGDIAEIAFRRIKADVLEQAPSESRAAWKRPGPAKGSPRQSPRHVVTPQKPRQPKQKDRRGKS
jgi:hypothetical protein